MGKPNPVETTAPAPGAGAKTIHAEPGKPWPDPPAVGRWSRNPDTGDLTLVEAVAQPPSEEERRARREKQREAALKAANTTHAKE